LLRVKKRVWSIPVRQEYIGFTGNIKNAVFLTQLIYWAERANRADGGVYKTSKQWQAELGLSKRELENARKTLEDLGILTVEPHRANGHFTNHYYLDFKALEREFKAYLSIEDDVLEAEYVEEVETPAQVCDGVESAVVGTVTNRTGKTNQTIKTPMPKNFTPSVETMDSLKAQGYHPSLLEQYLKDCRRYYTVKHHHHRYADWDEAYRRWCSTNPKTDANTERLERLQDLSTKDIFGEEDFDTIFQEYYDHYYGENAVKAESAPSDGPDEYGRW
jgi:hypothetical protein